MRNLVPFSIVPICLFMLHCATTYHVKVLKPSEINLGSIKRLAVLDFEFIGDWDFNIEDKKVTLEEVLTKAIARKVGVLPPPPRKPHPRTAFAGSEVSAAYITHLVNNGHYSVAEREKLTSVLREQGLSLSGAVDENTATRIGNLLGVEALIIGSGRYFVKDVGQWEEHEKKDAKGKKVLDAGGQPVKVLKYRAMRRVDVNITYRVVNTETGQVIASRSNSSRNYRESSSGSSCQDDALADTKAEAITRLPAWRPIVERHVQSIANLSVKQIAPHYVSRKRVIENGKMPPMKAAIEYVKRNMWQEARQAWESVLADQSEKAVKDHVAATYNLGVYHEIHGELDRAEELFDQCFTKSGKTKYLDAKANIKYRREELKRLEQQINE